MTDKCPLCGISVPDMPEDAAFEERLCDTCYAEREKEIFGWHMEPEENA